MLYKKFFTILQINAENYCEYTGDRQGMIDKGYTPCKNCSP